MSHPLVSVLIPAYNAERHVAGAVASALGQTYPNTEVVVVDDGSTDGTADVLAPFAERGVRVIRQANAGACAARNRALEEARGDYLQYLDADDFLSPDKIGAQVDLLEASPAGCLAVCGTVYFEDGTDPEAGRFSPGTPALNSDDPVQWLVDLWTPKRGWGMVQPNAWLTPRAVAAAAGPWDPEVTQDQDGEYFARVVLASAGVRWSPQGRNYYRKFGGDSVSAGRSARHLHGRLRAADAKAQLLLPRTTDANRAQAEAALAHQYAALAVEAYPAHPNVVRKAEARLAELGGSERTFFGGTRLRYVERWLGWKAARRVSTWYRSRADA